MEIKPREVLFSVIIALVMLAIGIALHNAIQQGVTQTAEIYATALYGYQTPQSVIESKQGAGTLIAILFWIFWPVVIGGAVYGFCYFENRWLD